MDQIVSGDSVDLSTPVEIEPSSLSGVMFLDGKPLCALSSPLIDREALKSPLALF